VFLVFFRNFFLDYDGMGLMSAMEQNFNPSLADVNRKTRQGTIVLFVVCVFLRTHTHTHTQLIVKLWMLIPFFAPVCFYFPILLQATLNG
jgi:hypothetical protein